MDRRKFVQTAVAGTAGIAASISGVDLIAAEKKSKKAEEPSEKITDLKFKDGKFRIMQLTDTHYVYGNPKSQRAFDNVKEMLEKEKPDLVIHTGDIIFGKPAKESFETILGLLSDSGIPWAVALGNHDGEFGLDRREAFELIKTLPGNINDGAKGIYGCSNDIITLSNSEGKRLWALYLLDSGNKISLASKGLKVRSGYDYIHFDQLAWYRDHSIRFAEENGGAPLPSLSFFHIPLPEYNKATRFDTVRVMKGNFGEEPYSSNVNSGLWGLMREREDVKGIFCGHDHDNDYAMAWNEMLLAFGRFGGCDTVYNDLKPSGCRMIELTEGKDSFRTWIRVYGRGVEQDNVYPDDFKTVL